MSAHHMDPEQRERLFRQEEARLRNVFAQLERTVQLGLDYYVQDGLTEFNDKLADAEYADELLAQLSTPVYLQKMTLEQLRAELTGEPEAPVDNTPAPVPSDEELERQLGQLRAQLTGEQ